MKHQGAIAWAVATIAAAQGPLGADLERAADRFPPVATVAPDEVDTLAAQAGEHYRAGRINEAVAALDRGAAVAFRSGATGRSFELSLTAAEALRAAGRAAEAAERFQQAALRNPSDPRAAAAHHTAITTLAALLEGAPAETLDAYEELLDQHGATWPEAPTVAAARWELVELLARRGRWDALLEAARRVGPSDPRAVRAGELVALAHGGLLAKENSAERFEAARSDLQPRILADPTSWPERWSAGQRLAALVLAQGAMDQGPDGVEYARRLLRQALGGSPPPEADWRRRAAATLVVATLAAGQTDEVGAWMKLAHDSAPAEIERLLTATHRRVLAREGTLAAEASRLADTVAQLAAESTAGSAPSASALADAGRYDEAQQTAARLAAERPDDRLAQAEYAKTLAQSPDAADREMAIAHWRTIETRSEPGSSEWFAARLERVRLLVAVGRRDDAQKLLALTRVLAPSMGGEASRGGFEELSRTLGVPPER